MKHSLNIFFFSLMGLSLLSLTGCNPEMLHASAPIRVKDPWLRWEPETNSGELYLYVVNKSSVDDTLLGARSELATSVEIYNSPTGNIFSDVEQVSTMALPVEGGLILLPGGPHLKFVGLTDLTPGQLVPITLQFEQAGEFSFYVEAH